MEGIGCIPTTVPTYISCPAGVNVWIWGHNIQGKDVQNVQYGTMSRHEQWEIMEGIGLETTGVKLRTWTKEGGGDVENIGRWLTQFCRSVTFWYGSGSADVTTDLRTRIRNLLFSSVADKMSMKNKLFQSFLQYFLNVHFHQSSKIKSQKEVIKK